MPAPARTMQERVASAPVWTVRGGAEPFPGDFCLWGIVNVTPDSFHDGGRFFSAGTKKGKESGLCDGVARSTQPASGGVTLGAEEGPDVDAAVAHALRLAEEGARVLDIGGASSRSGAADVPAEEERRRVLPVLEKLVRAAGSSGGTAPLLSVDTWRAEVAAAVLEAGADIINDISACAWEPALRDVVAQYRPGYVLMHCQGRPDAMQAAPRYDHVVDDVIAFFEREMRALTAAGLPENRILLDPGIGFGKTGEHNRALLVGVERLLALGRPLLLGVSHKTLFGDLLGLPPGERGEATAVCTALMGARGVLHHRVHNVASARRALELARLLTPAGEDHA